MWYVTFYGVSPNGDNDGDVLKYIMCMFWSEIRRDIEVPPYSTCGISS